MYQKFQRILFPSIVLLAMLLSACSDLAVSERNTSEILQDIQLSIDQDVYPLDTKWIQFTITNNRSAEFIFGDSTIDLEIQDGKDWKLIPRGAVNAAADIVPAGKSQSRSVGLENWPDFTFKKGRYRVIVNELSDDKPPKWAYAEFDME